ncbi:MAG: molybdopterin-dependent oxidoreductase [bacterium]
MITTRVCPLCEATCGIEVILDGDRVETIRGDAADTFSRGYLCPKAYGLKGLQEDPDRLRQPLRRTAAGFEPIGWDEAFALVVEGLQRAQAAGGKDAVGVYLGNPVVHNVQTLLYGPALLKALGSRQLYSASSADQLPKMISSALMFGGSLKIPVPDLDRTDFLLVLGADPMVSNGSLMTAPDVKHRLAAIRDRGTLVVVDPRRSATAQMASEHLRIRPGTDALLLLALCQVVVAEDLATPAALAHLDGLETARALVADFPPERVAAACGLEAEAIRRLARSFCAAPSAACYGRIGTTCQAFGTLASWAVDLLNILSGNLDRPGGAMFATPAANRGANRAPDARRPTRLGRWKSRVAGWPERFGELPVCTLADEILTPGEGRIRAMITVAGNPALSAPGSARMAAAFADLDFYVAIDFYLNETTRHAHVILPPPSPLERGGYDLAFYQLAIRDVARYSAPTLPRPAGQPEEWEILLTLAKALMGMGKAPLAMADAFVLRQLAEREVAEARRRWPELELKAVLARLDADHPGGGPDRLLDLLLRLGPYGDGFGGGEGLSLAALRAAPHGVDLGPLKPQVPDGLGTPGGRIDLAPALIVADLDRLRAHLDAPAPDFVLIGRRGLRSNNSWMHNLPALVKGKSPCTLQIHPDDAARIGVAAGGSVRVESDAGAVVAPVEITADLLPGVVSLPHGWGHDDPHARLSVAAAHAGVNVNLVSDPRAVDAVSGNAAFNGLPVRLSVTP